MLSIADQIGDFYQSNPFKVAAEEVARYREEEELRVWRNRLDASGIPERFQNAVIAKCDPSSVSLDNPKPYRFVSLAECDPKVQAWFRAYQQGSGAWLTLFGSNGTGKTTQACACAVAACVYDQAYFSTMNGIISEIQSTFGTSQSADRVLYRYQNARLLVIDELEKFKATEWSANQMFELINGRYARDKATIFTTNAKPEMLFSALSEAAGEGMAASLLSRLLDSRNTSVRLTGKDHRL